ncbi:transposase, partial [Gibbsiella dentisursi]|uniref:transposase n=1 Tax=Gibbsiella dentisursi TaxID=796890 RepID=UPI0031F97AB4
MIKTRRTKRTFSPEFKLEAIEQVVKYQRDVREVAQALELNPDHLRKWIRLYKQELQGIESTGNAITPEQREIQQLKAQIKRLEMEKEILKQAAVDSIGQRNSHVKTWGCGGFLNETDIYSKGKS